MHQLISGIVCGEAIGSRCSLYKEKSELFLQASSAAAIGNTSDANDVDDGSKRSFSGHFVDSGIPSCYRTTIITHPKGEESLASYIERASEDGPVKTSKPHPPELARQEAYRYALRLTQKRQRRSIIEEFPGIENVAEDKATPAFIQSIINALPLLMEITSPVRRSLLIDCISLPVPDPFAILDGANSDANWGDDQGMGSTDQGNTEPDDSNC
ncbi:hypothetical protein FSST1_003829 [Fusarium sambucinum]